MRIDLVQAATWIRCAGSAIIVRSVAGLAIVIAALALSCPSLNAQTAKSKSVLESEASTNFPNNNVGAITPAIALSTFNDFIASWQQAPQVNAQVGTTYTFQASDYGQLVTFSNSGAVAVTLPQATGSFSPWSVFVQNKGAGTVTITPTTSTINGASTFAITQGQGYLIVSDSVNYQVWGGFGPSNVLPVANGGTGLSSGNSGGIPYFNSTTTMAPTGALAANSIMLGGGAGVAPFTSGCTINASNSITCSTATSTAPQFNLSNSTSDASASIFLQTKNRSGGNTNSGDVLGYYQFQGFANSAQQTTAQIIAQQSAAVSGSLVPSSFHLSTSNSTSPISQTLTFDNNAHLGVTAQQTAIAAATCTGFSLVSGNDFGGKATFNSATSCSLTFGGTYTTAPACHVSPGSSVSTVEVTTNTTTLSITFGTAQTAFSWICVGN